MHEKRHKDCKKMKATNHLPSSSADKWDSSSASDSRTDVVQDTVGAVAMDINGNLSSGVSSGGISLKQSGRIGPVNKVEENWKGSI